MLDTSDHMASVLASKGLGPPMSLRPTLWATAFAIVLLVPLMVVGCGSAPSRYRVVSPGPFDDYLGGPAVGEASPDGDWTVDFTRRGSYGNLDLTNRQSHRVFRMYHSNDSCCTEITWLPPHLLLFDDDYRVLVLDPTTRRLKTIAGFSNFIVSGDGRWIAGYASSGGHVGESVRIVTAAGGSCLMVPHKTTEDDTPVTFTSDDKAIRISRTRFGPGTARARILTFTLTHLRPRGAC